MTFYRVLFAPKRTYISFASSLLEHPNEVVLLSVKVEDLFFAKAAKKYLFDEIGTIVVNSDFYICKGGQIQQKSFIVRNARCFAYSDIVLLQNNDCLLEAKENRVLRANAIMRDEILLRDNENWCKIKRCKISKQIPRAIKIGGVFGYNYYHVLMQLLPKLFESSEMDASIPLLVDRETMEVSNMRHLVECLNTYNREVICMDYGVEYQVDELYLITVPYFGIPDFKKGVRAGLFPSTMYSPNVLNALRRRISESVSVTISPKRIFICRQQYSKTRSYNEEECFRALESLGFERVYPERLSVFDQVSLFVNADIIVAPTGAALTNIIFVHPGCKILVLTNQIEVVEPMWSTIALTMNAECYTIGDARFVGKTTERISADFQIDAFALKAFAQTLLS